MASAWTRSASASKHGRKGNGYALDRVYVDAGISRQSARTIDRNCRRALDATCKAKGVDCVFSLSRLARSTRDTLAIAERLDKSGADLVSAV
jgi:site-specific DNA recombinase